MTLIESTDNIFHQAEGQRVYLSKKLGDWGDPVAYLYCDQLELVVAPSIDQAVFSYHFDDFIQQLNGGAGGVYPPLDFYRKYVKLELLDAAGEIILTWFGYFGNDEQQLKGSLAVTSSSETTYIPKGTQRPTAFGLLYLLETTIIDSSEIETRAADPLVSPSTESMTVGRGITFNGTDGIPWAQRGNRSDAKSGDYDGYIFADLPYGASLWDAEAAVKYLLEFHPPKTPAGTNAAKLVYSGTAEALSWYDKTVRTDLRNVKDVLDDLIDRRRGVGYYVTCSEANDEFEIIINVFTFADQNVDLGDGQVLPQNPNQTTLNFETALDVGDVTLTNNLTQLVGSVIVYGAPITVVCTLKPGDTGLKPGWTDATEDDYLSGDSAAADYAALGKSDQEKRNQAARSRDVFDEVYSRFVLAPDFTGQIDHLEDGEPAHYILPNLDSLLDITSNDVTAAFATTYESSGNDRPAPPCWWRGKRFLPELPLRGDASILAPVDSYRRPFVLFEVVADADPANRIYEFGHQLATNSDNEDPARARSWSVGLDMLDTEPGVRMTVLGAPPHMIAKNNWIDAATTNQAIDPDPDENFRTGALDWKDPDKTHPTLWTIAIQSDDRLVETWESPTLFQEKILDTDLSFAWERRKVIMVPDAQLTLIAPGTVTDLTSGGQLVIDTKGSIYEDDRDRLRRIAAAAGQWYGTQRQSITMSYQQLNPLGLSLGDLITSIGDNYSAQDVNSPLTRLRFDFLNVSTSLETSFAELDFVNEPGPRS